MKKLHLVLPVLAMYLGVFGVVSCATIKPIAKTVIDIADVLCLVANATMDDEAVLLTCKIVDEHKDDAKKLLAEHRRTALAMAKMASSPCPVDAGAMKDAGKDGSK